MNSTLHFEDYVQDFEERGPGEPILLMHGFTGAGADWRPLIPMLPRGYRYLAPDLPGHGRSPNPHPEYRHGRAAEAVFQCLDALGVGRLRAIGMSGGAMALLHMATQQPERIDAMVLVSATTHYPPQARAIMAATDADSQPEDAWEAMRQKHPHGDEQIRTLWRQAQAFKDDHDDMNFQPSDLAAIRARTLLVHGDSDPLFPIDIAETMRAHIPNAELWTLAGGGHVPVFGDAMGEFFARAAAFLTPVKETI